MVRSAALASLSAALPGSLLAQERRSSSLPPLITRAIPSSGERIPVVGIGTNQFREANYAELRAVLSRMADLGGTVIDTAPLYGDSESVIGKALVELNLRRKMFVATKFNAPGATFLGTTPAGIVGSGAGVSASPAAASAAPAASASGGAPASATPPPADSFSGPESFERSLERLQTDRLDLLMAHFISSVEALMPVMLELKKNGRIRYCGITTTAPQLHPQLMDYMRRYPIDFIQVDYSLRDRSAAADVLPLAKQLRIAVMAAVPLGGGRNSLLHTVAGRELPKWASDFDATTWSQFFLKYVVSHPAVTCAIPGSTKVSHVEENQGAARGRLPDQTMRRTMEEFWDGVG